MPARLVKKGKPQGVDNKPLKKEITDLYLDFVYQ